MNRRGFLAAMLGAAAAPAIVKADNLMKIVVPKREIIIARELPFWDFDIAATYPEKISIHNHVGDLDICSMYYHSTPAFDLSHNRVYATAMPLIAEKHLGIIR